MKNKIYQKQLKRSEKQRLVALRLKQYPELSDRAIARQLGVSHSYVGRIRTELGLKIHLDTAKNEWVNHPYLKANPEIIDTLTPRNLRAIKAPGVLDVMAEIKSKSPVYAQRVLLKRNIAEHEKAAAEITVAGYELYVADIAEGLLKVDDESVSAIITDIPYDANSIAVSRALSEVAGRVLKPSGTLAVMCGQSYLPPVISELCSNDRLTYRWVMSYTTPQRANDIKPIRTYSRWKPVVILTKGEFNWKSLGDTITAPPDKNDTEHPHAQSVEGMVEIIKRFTQYGDTVLDPCMGSGTTGLACLELKRNFIGIDINEEWVEIAKKRIEHKLTTSIPQTT